MSWIISFDKNDGSTNSPRVTFDGKSNNCPEIMPAISNVPTEQGVGILDWSREGYNFLGWQRTLETSDTYLYQPGDDMPSSISIAGNGGEIFYAIWEEQRRVISKIQLPNGQVSHIGADWQDISNKPTLTREQVIEIIEDLYPNATSAEIEEMADEVLENSNIVEDVIEYLLATDSTTPTEYAPVDSPHLTGVPTAPTANENTNTTQIATTAFVQTAVGSKLTRQDIIDIIEDLCPEATSNEIENMADDILENYNTVTEDMIEEILSRESGTPISYAPAASPQLTGVPTAPTAAAGTNTTQIATTAFVQQAIANIGNVQGVLYGN